jgi:hypothetical protein
MANNKGYCEYFKERDSKERLKMVSIYERLCLERLSMLKDMLINNYPITFKNYEELVEEAVKSQSKVKLIRCLSYLNESIDQLKGPIK